MASLTSATNDPKSRPLTLVRTKGFRTEGIVWDGRDDFGDRIGRGTYVYKVKVEDNQGNKVEKYEKLVLLK